MNTVATVRISSVPEQLHWRFLHWEWLVWHHIALKNILIVSNYFLESINVKN
jgi:hypothetical protein